MIYQASTWSAALNWTAVTSHPYLLEPRWGLRNELPPFCHFPHFSSELLNDYLHIAYRIYFKGCRRSLTMVTPVKYERDFEDLTDVFVFIKVRKYCKRSFCDPNPESVEKLKYSVANNTETENYYEGRFGKSHPVAYFNEDVSPRSAKLPLRFRNNFLCYIRQQWQ